VNWFANRWVSRMRALMAQPAERRDDGLAEADGIFDH
jgi:hypothetical protein